MVLMTCLGEKDSLLSSRRAKLQRKCVFVALDFVVFLETNNHHMKQGIDMISMILKCQEDCTISYFVNVILESNKYIFSYFDIIARKRMIIRVYQEHILIHNITIRIDQYYLKSVKR